MTGASRRDRHDLLVHESVVSRDETCREPAGRAPSILPVLLASCVGTESPESQQSRACSVRCKGGRIGHGDPACRKGKRICTAVGLDGGLSSVSGANGAARHGAGHYRPDSSRRLIRRISSPAITSLQHVDRDPSGVLRSSRITLLGRLYIDAPPAASISNFGLRERRGSHQGTPRKDLSLAWVETPRRPERGRKRRNPGVSDHPGPGVSYALSGLPRQRKAPASTLSPLT